MKQRLDLRYRSDQQSKRLSNVLILDWINKNGEEFIIIDQYPGQIRMDYIISIEPLD